MSRLTAPTHAEAVLDGPRWSRTWFAWVSRVTQSLSGRIPVQLAAYAIADLPSAAEWRDCAVIVTDDAGGRALAHSDGTIWKRAYDNAEVGP